jgi:ATP-dependent RNA helicase SUPV3L1/SUV3
MGQPVARLVPGSDGLSPRVEIIADDLLDHALREPIEKRLQSWVRDHLTRQLGTLMDLHAAVTGKGVSSGAPVESSVGGEAPLTGIVRGIAFRLVENLGLLDRRAVADEVRLLDQSSRGLLRRYGVRFGEFSLYFPALLKPAQSRLLVVLWGVQNDIFGRAAVPGISAPTPPAPGLCSVQVEDGNTPAFYAASGFRVCGNRAVRADMLERLGELIRKARSGEDTQRGGVGRPSAGESIPEPETQAGAETEKTAIGETAPGAAAEEAPPAASGSAPDAVQDVTPEETHTAEGEETPQPDQARAVGEDIVPAGKPDTGTAEAAPEPAESAAIPVPRGAFTINADMMSLVGCSGAEFDEILKSLGYRAQTWFPNGKPAPGAESAAEAEESGAETFVIWRPRPRGRPAGKRPGGPAPEDKDVRGRKHAGGPRHKARGRDAKDGKDGGKPHRPPRKHGQPKGGPDRGKPGRGPREKPYDPDSPFAALAALKLDKRT